MSEGVASWRRTAEVPVLVAAAAAVTMDDALASLACCPCDIILDLVVVVVVVVVFVVEWFCCCVSAFRFINLIPKVAPDNALFFVLLGVALWLWLLS